MVQLAEFLCCFRGQSQSQQHIPVPSSKTSGTRRPETTSSCVATKREAAAPEATSVIIKPSAEPASSESCQRHLQLQQQQPTSVISQWANVLSTLTEVEGSWLMRLQSSATALHCLVPGGMVSLCAVFGSTYVPLVATGHGSETLALDLGVPCTMVLMDEEMNSVERLLLSAGAEEDWDSALTPVSLACATAPAKALCDSGMSTACSSAPKVAPLTSHGMQQLPPDWQALASQHGLRSFMCLPLTKSRRMLGVLTLACPHAWSSSPLSHLSEDRQAALAILMVEHLQAPELWVACGLLHSLSLAGDIEQVVRAVCSATAQLCTSAYYQTPTCRLALMCQDAPTAVLFESDGTANYSSSPATAAAPMSPALGRRGSSAHLSTHGPLTRRASARATMTVGSLATSSSLLPLGQQTPQSPLLVGTAGQYSPQQLGRRPGLSGLSRSMASCGPGAAAGSPLRKPSYEVSGIPPPLMAGNMRRHSSGLPCSPGASSHSSPGAGGRQDLAHGRALELRQTLLGAAVEAQGAVAWLPDCTSYVQEGHEYLHDQVISKANRTVGSMVVAVGRPRPGAPPLLAAYCTFRTPQPDIMLESLGGRLRELMQVVAPLVWRKLQREMAAEWQLLHEEAAERLGGGSRPPKPRKASTQPSVMAAALLLESAVARAEPAGSQLSPGPPPHGAPMLARRGDLGPMVPSPLPFFNSPRGSRGGELSNCGSAATGPGSNCGSATRPGSNCGSFHPSTGASMDGVGMAHLTDPSGHHPLHEVSSGMSESRASFAIEKLEACHSTANKMAPIMAGVHDRLMQMQMSRLLYGSAQDHQEELEAIVVLRKIGEGGFASVHHGKFHGLDVAIKIMKQNGGGRNATDNKPDAHVTHTVDVLSKATEVAVMFSVSHPNIVQVMTFFTDVIVKEEPLDDGNGHTRLVLEALAPHAFDDDATPPSTMMLNDVDEGDATAAAEERHSNSPGPLEPTTRPPQQPLSIVVCMELCDMGTLWRAVCKGAFRHAGSGNGTGKNGGKQSSVDLLLAPPKFSAIYHTLLEVALALRHLHSLSLVHCDLKASNVLLKSNKLDPRGFTCKLSDFGLVKLMAEDEEGNVVIPSDISSGTLTHMAPEIFSRRSRLTSSVDIYAFGIMMYEIVVGQLAYKGVAGMEVTRAVVKEHLRPQFPDHVPDDYRDLAEACWHCNPDHRPDSSTLVNVLEALLYTSQNAESGGGSISK